MTDLQIEIDQSHKAVLYWLSQQQGNYTLTKAYSTAINFLFLTASAMNKGEPPKFPVYSLDTESAEDHPDIIINSVFLEYSRAEISQEVFEGNKINYTNPHHILDLTDEIYRFQVTKLIDTLKQKIASLQEWSGEKSRKVVSLDALLSHNLHFTLLGKGYDFSYN